MTYNINSYNGQLVAKVPDGTIDQNSLAVSLIGRNAVNFGETINENFVKLLENFSSVTAPDKAIKGQLWFDSSLGKLKVFDGVMWKPTGGAIVSPTRPSNLVDGDIWINSNERRAYFYDGNSASTILMGPAYSRQQGKSGFEIISVADQLRRTQTVCALYVQDTLLGVFAKSTYVLGDNSSTLGSAWTNRAIIPGFNSADIAGLLFDVTASSANGLKLVDGTIKESAEVAFLNEENTFTQNQIIDASLAVSGSITSVDNTDLVLSGARINVSNTTIANLVDDPVDRTTAVTKGYVDDLISAIGNGDTTPRSDYQPIGGLTLDATGLSDSDVSKLLREIFPPNLLPENVRNYPGPIPTLYVHETRSAIVNGDLQVTRRTIRWQYADVYDLTDPQNPVYQGYREWQIVATGDYINPLYGSSDPWLPM